MSVRFGITEGEAMETEMGMEFGDVLQMFAGGRHESKRVHAVLQCSAVQCSEELVVRGPPLIGCILHDVRISIVAISCETQTHRV
jgi:hypothetical protein